MPTNAPRVIGQLLHIKARVTVCVWTCVCAPTCTYGGITGGSRPQLLNFCKAFFFSLIGRRAAVTYHPHKPLPPASCLSSQRRHMAAFQAHPPRTLSPGRGLCSPRCGCPTPSRPLMYIWKRRTRLVPGRDWRAGPQWRKWEEPYNSGGVRPGRRGPTPPHSLDE